jgi:transcriptional regulator with XRE-family HTH domain
MRPISQHMFPETKNILTRLGEKIRSKRKKRKITIAQLATNAGTTRSTIGLIEKGTPGVSIGTYLQVMYALGFQKTLEIIATENIEEHFHLHRQLNGKNNMLSVNHT